MFPPVRNRKKHTIISLREKTEEFHKKIIATKTALLVLCLVMTGCPAPGTDGASIVAVTGISLNPDSASLNSAGALRVTATVSPANATDKTVSWTSSDTSAATVSDVGLVTAVAVGTATVTVSTQDGGLRNGYRVRTTHLVERRSANP
jgi:hypothetical protein